MSEREILDRLIESGKITEEDVSKIMTPAKRELVEIVHLMMCNENHDTEDRFVVKKCGWYVEEQLDNAWNRPAHLKGIGRADDILRRFNLSVNRAVNDLNEIRAVIGRATSDGYMGLLRFILSTHSTKLIPESNTKDSTSSSDDSSLSG